MTEEEDAIQSEIDCKQQSLGSSSSIHQDQQGGDEDPTSELKEVSNTYHAPLIRSSRLTGALFCMKEYYSSA